VGSGDPGQRVVVYMFVPCTRPAADSCNTYQTSMSGVLTACVTTIPATSPTASGTQSAKRRVLGLRASGIVTRTLSTRSRDAESTIERSP
jgi:hypothetical protein